MNDSLTTDLPLGILFALVFLLFLTRSLDPVVSKKHYPVILSYNI
jgi:hypothetical protein